MLKNEKPNTISMSKNAYRSMSALAASTALSGSPPREDHSLARNMSVPRTTRHQNFKKPLDKDIEQHFFEAYLSKNPIKPLADNFKVNFLNSHKDDWNQIVEIFKKYKVNLPVMSGGKRKKKTRRRKKKKRTRRKK